MNECNPQHHKINIGGKRQTWDLDFNASLSTTQSRLILHHRGGFWSWLFFIFQLETTLKNIYGYLQRLAVGLEQVVLDQNVYDGRFMEEFNEAEFKLKAVITFSCLNWDSNPLTAKSFDQLQSALIHLGTCKLSLMCLIKLTGMGSC